MRPGRFFHDKKAQRLYYVHNDSLGTPPPASLAFSLPLVERLIVFNGTQEAPVRGVTISGVGLRDAVASYLLPHGVPSGGDWALQRSAAVFMEGTIGARLEGLAMERCDGNAVMLSGCTIHKDASSFCARASVSLTQKNCLVNRNASILHSEIRWTGDSAIAAWGKTDELSDGGLRGYDGTDGNHPLDTLVAGNVIREVGTFEKQSSFFFRKHQSKRSLSSKPHIIIVCANRSQNGAHDHCRQPSLQRPSVR